MKQLSSHDESLRLAQLDSLDSFSLLVSGRTERVVLSYVRLFTVIGAYLSTGTQSAMK